MKVKTVQLDDLTRDVLMRSRIEGCNLHLPEQLERADYERVAKAIKAAGGKWNRHAGCHVFPADVRQTLNITDESVAVVNVQQTYQAFYTPPEIAREMVWEAGLWKYPKLRVLEPSAGNGRLIDAIGAQLDWHVDLTAVEINEREADALFKRLSGGPASVMVIRGDFLQQNGDLGYFDRVVMNPPFTAGQDIAHIKHALTMVKPGGRLVALCANGGRQKESLQPLACKWRVLPAGSFKESGTGVTVAMVTIEVPEPAPAPKAKPAPAVAQVARAQQAEFAL